jgi:hypothetical protein
MTITLHITPTDLSIRLPLSTRFLSFPPSTDLSTILLAHSLPLILTRFPTIPTNPTPTGTRLQRAQARNPKDQRFQPLPVSLRRRERGRDGRVPVFEV